MKWKHQELNKYPDIILSDCVIVGIQRIEDKIVIYFSEHGFIVKSSDDNKYYRTDGAQIIIEGCDVEDIVIKEIRTQQLSEGLYYDSMYDINIGDFLKKINTGKWSLEIVEEFYSTEGAFYIGQVKDKDDSFWCHINIRFKKLIYLWNNIKWNFPIS